MAPGQKCHCFFRRRCLTLHAVDALHSGPGSRGCQCTQPQSLHLHTHWQPGTPLTGQIPAHMQWVPQALQTPRVKEPGCPQPKMQHQASLVVQLDAFCTTSRPANSRLHQSSRVDMRCWDCAGGGHYQHHRRIFSTRSERGGSSSSGAGSNEGKASHVAASSASTPAFTGNRGGLQP